MESMILWAFFLAAGVVLAVSVARMVRSRGAGTSESTRERSEREIERDRQTGLIWLCILGFFVGFLVLVYLVTR